jgi:hypothetical protein
LNIFFGHHHQRSIYGLLTLDGENVDIDWVEGTLSSSLSNAEGEKKSLSDLANGESLVSIEDGVGFP